MSCAVAIFVKTPGRSPLKTRLARGIGGESAERFYELSCAATEAIVREAMRREAGAIQAYWAVAEPEAERDPVWSGLPTVSQGGGDLADRLYKVYSLLLSRHDSVQLIGADSPQLEPEALLKTSRLVTPTRFVLGRSSDGGFYLLAGARPIAHAQWRRIPFSTDKTAAILSEVLLESRQPTAAEIEELPELCDVDTEAELPLLRAALAKSAASLLPEQRALLDWLDAQF